MDNLRKSFLVKGNSIIGAVGDKYFSNAPIGVIQAFSGNTVPHGYLLANGASYKVADYPDLYAVIGNTYGGDTENFNVPTVQPPALTMVYIIKAFHTNEGVDSGVSDDVVEYVEGEIAKVETDMDKVVKYPDWSNQQTISLTEITVDQDVYIELNQLSSSPIEGLKINGKEVSISNAENGLYSTRFSGYVKKGSFVSYPYLTNANIVRVFPLV